MIEAGIRAWVRKPKRNTSHVQKDPGPTPGHLHQTPSPCRPAPPTAAACKKRFCLLFRRLWKVGRLQARSARRNEVVFSVEVEAEAEL